MIERVKQRMIQLQSSFNYYKIIFSVQQSIYPIKIKRGVDERNNDQSERSKNLYF